MNAGLMIIFGRKLVHKAKDNNAIHPSAYGSMPGKTAQGALLHKRMTLDLLIQNKDAGGLYEYDASGCYDRMLPSLQTIFMRRMDLQGTVTQSMTKIMHKMKRYVGTKLGTSKKYIQTNGNSILFEIGQGSGGGPTVWLCHWTVLFELIKKMLHTSKYKSPTGIIEVVTPGMGYVDDCNLTVKSTMNGKDRRPVMTLLKGTAQAWGRFLFATGGI